MPSGIDLVLADHEVVAALFEQYAAAPSGAVIGQVVGALTAHDDAEQAALYPLAAQLLGEGAVAPDLQAHERLKGLFEHLRALEGPPLDAAFAELRRMVEQHVADEEQRLLPALAQAATPQQLDALGARILQAKARVG